jgi:hypothetical protein
MKTKKDCLLELLNEFYHKIQFDEDILKEDVEQKEIDLLCVIVSILKKRHEAYVDKQTLVGKFKNKIKSCIKGFDQEILEYSGKRQEGSKRLPMYLKVDENQKIIKTNTNQYVNQYKNS